MPWLSTLGGIEALRRKLGEPFTVTPYPDGVMIRAGEDYGVIDTLLRAKDPGQLTNLEKHSVAIPPHYRRFAEVLKPVRVTELSHSRTLNHLQRRGKGKRLPGQIKPISLRAAPQ